MLRVKNILLIPLLFVLILKYFGYNSILSGTAFRDTLAADMSAIIVLISLLFTDIISGFWFVKLGRLRIGVPVVALRKLPWFEGVLIIVVVLGTVLNNWGSSLFEAQYGSDEYTREKFITSSWNIVYLTALAFLLSYTNSTCWINRYKYLFILVLLYPLVFGNRAEVFGILILLMSELNIKKYKVLLLGFLGIFLLYIVGIVRGLADKNLDDVFNIMRSLGVIYIPTYSSVAYSSLAGIIHSPQYSMIEMLMRYLPSILPFLKPFIVVTDYSEIVGLLYHTRGGMYYAAEFFASFGFWTFPMLIVLNYVISLFDRAKISQGFLVVKYTIIMVLFKSLFYGLVYLLNAIVLIAIIFSLMYYFGAVRIFKKTY